MPNEIYDPLIGVNYTQNCPLCLPNNALGLALQRHETRHGFLSQQQ